MHKGEEIVTKNLLSTFIIYPCSYFILLKLDKIMEPFTWWILKVLLIFYDEKYKCKNIPRFDGMDLVI